MSPESGTNLARRWRQQRANPRRSDLELILATIPQLGPVSAMANLAATLRHRGELDRARDLQQRVLEERRRQFGEEHPNRVWAMASLAGTVREQGELDQARELQERVLESRRIPLGEEHPDTLWAMGSVAATLARQGQKERAQELKELAAEGFRRVLGEEHPDTLCRRPIGVSQTDHEQAWSQNEQLRSVLPEIRPTLERYAELLAEVAGAPALGGRRGADGMG